MRPIKVYPIYDKTIWGGNRLSKIRGRTAEGEGTAWEISIHPYAQSVISEGEYAGKTLAELVKTAHDALLGREIQDEDLLRAAFLDAKDSLSVQVHPGEAYAQAHEADHGKTEAWYILDADEGASLVAGSDFQSPQAIRDAIAGGTIEDHLYRIPVTEGDFVLVPSGTLHALGAGILALEIGTNSNTTYRFYDYHRKDANGNERPLHIEKSIDVVCFGQKGTCIHTPVDHIAKEKRVADFPEYTVDLIDVCGSYTLKAHPKTFRTLSCVSGDCSIQDEAGETRLGYTESVFLPASCGDLVISGDCRLLVGTPKPRSIMCIEEPKYTEDFSVMRSDAEITTGTKYLKEIAGYFLNTDGVDPETPLYEVQCDNGDATVPGSLSYGVTTVYPVTINGECAFTKGHWHEDETIEEVYEGQAGSGLLMLMDHNGRTWCEKVFPGSVHRIHGNLAHRLINTGEVPMKVRAVWPPIAGHNYDAVAAQPFGFRVFREGKEIKVKKHE